jgi:hypothetical protein
VSPLQYLNDNPNVFYTVFLVIVVFNVVAFGLGGRKAEKLFPKLDGRNIQFRERGASGHSKKNIFTKLGGASRVLDLIVTDGELWIKGIFPMFTFIGTKYDLTHRVSLSKIEKSIPKKKSIELWFENEAGEKSHVELRVKDVPAFTKALGA